MYMIVYVFSTFFLLLGRLFGLFSVYTGMLPPQLDREKWRLVGLPYHVKPS